jgi:hypothetical protein
MWQNPKSIKEIIPVLIISKYNDKSAAKENFNGVMNIIRNNYSNEFLNNLQVYTFDVEESIMKMARHEF